MRLLIDTNVILDYLLSREGFHEQAKEIFDLAQYAGDFEFVSSSAVTDIFYHARKELKDTFEAQDRIRGLLTFFSVLNVTEQDIRAALDMRWKDFEDAYSTRSRLRIMWTPSSRGTSRTLSARTFRY